MCRLGVAFGKVEQVSIPKDRNISVATHKIEDSRREPIPK